jgi:PAS domain S-box-containing protein
VISDHNAVVKFVNKAYTRITGVSPSQIIGKKITDVRKGARLPSVLASGKPLYGIRRKERNIEYVADIDPVFSEGKVIGAIAILRDISEIEELGKKVLAYSSKVEKFKNKMMEIHRAIYALDDIIGKSEGISRVKKCVRPETSPDRFWNHCSFSLRIS